MLYLVGGTARSGKTKIAQRFLAETGIPFFSLDLLMMGLARGLPEYGIDPEDDEWKVGDLLWPVVRGMATALIEDEIDYLIEGAQLRPRHARELCDQWDGHVRACFVGFAEMDTVTKFTEIRRFGGGVDDWLRGFEDRALIDEVERLKAFSERVRIGCSHCGQTYLEASADLWATVEAVVRYLRES